MCGIAAIFSASGNISSRDKERMDRGILLQNHRGPDATGVFSDDHVVLGHNRLSIIDLSDSSNQPFYRPDLGYRIIFNGEIYNYRELKRELIQKGFEFHSDSDTEVILVAYKAYGNKVCSKLIGMFAFLIYDEKQKSIFVARDRFGEKPIFYISDREDKIYLASELSALASIYPRDLTINQDAVVDLIENLYISDFHTIYREVNQFPKAHYLLGKHKFELSQYYKLPSELGENIPFDVLKKHTKDKLYKIIQRELHADVPVASFLSSGIDSSLITAIANDLKPGIQAITMGTSDKNMDETSGAKEFAKKLNINHEVVPVDIDSLSRLGNILKDIQPLADASLIPSFMVTDQIKSRYKVMLSGDGGDELFGSYNRTNLYQSVKFRGILGGNKVIEKVLGNHNSWVEKQFATRLNDRNRMTLGGWSGYYRRHNLNNSLVSKVFNKSKNIHATWQKFVELEKELGENHSKISFHVDYATKLPGAFLYKIDSAAMHSSVEVRAPFLDHTLVDYLMSVPVDSMMPNRIDKELTKSILEDFTGKVKHGPKKGFSIPYASFMQNEWGELLESMILEGVSSIYFDFNREGIISLIKQHRTSPTPTLARVLFGILVLEIWLRVFHLKVPHDFLTQKI
ncbi:Asparagine synthetase [Indibacter alkaliphilus LW1]|uniref:asparagine synthase (glutamine-hydrolyzing) n=1 Tax=Indibacter alkaliphilus (strain CCUG 57479 / KCTC 22604 / LW1) TaxID=1189612 RepID=S2DF57_INDAL|nr:asparagine synthase (glutamine-hydrolyzing) [Indibacter alkaliphilus]EOZ95665.1 Asparagine synthetase [Indibacter alkaliphilus LW1]